MDEALSLDPINNYSHPEVRAWCASINHKIQTLQIRWTKLWPQSVTLAVQDASTMFLLGSRHTDGTQSESDFSSKSLMSSELSVTPALDIFLFFQIFVGHQSFLSGH